MTLTQNRFGWRSYTLGVFILFQLIYLPAANFIKLIALRLPESTGELDDDIQLHGQQFSDRVQSLADILGTAFVRYGELTGQAQGWSLFAPIFGHQASLPAVGIAPQGPEPHAPPSDIYFRLPNSRCRLFNYEYRLALLYWTWDKKTFEENKDAWRKAVFNRVKRQHRSMMAFLRWHCERALQAYPTMKNPERADLWATLISGPPISDPTLFNRDRQAFPIAVWKRTEVVPAGMLPVQARDPYSLELIWLPIEDEP
jgi:hypothetical protein